MATQGANQPGTVVSDATVGTIAWTNPNEAKASDDTWAQAPSNGISEYLLCTNFGFTIPDGAGIDGITVTVEKNKFDAVTCTDEHVKIVKGGSIGSTNKADTSTNWNSTTDSTASYGGVSDLWGETWAASDINGSTFGVVVSSDMSGSPGFDIARIDQVLITVTFSPKVQINIGDEFKEMSAMQINISDVWKDVNSIQINIGDVWKTIF